MKSIMLGIIAIAISGCYTPMELRTEGTTLNFASGKTAEAASNCIIRATDNFHSDFSTSATSNAQSIEVVVRMPSVGAISVIDIDGNHAGSTITVHRLRMTLWGERFENMLRSTCS